MDGQGVGNLHRSTFDKTSFAVAMHDLLGHAVEAELMMNSVISAYLGRSLEAILLLEAKAISQMSVNSRITLLEEIMQREGWDQDFPFVIPVLRAIFTMRNKLAHSVAYGFDLSVRSSVRRGSASEEAIPVKTIRGLARSAHFVTNVEMSFLHVRALPVAYWMAE